MAQGGGWYALDLVSKELLLTLVQVAVEPLVELLAALDGEWVVDGLACEFAQDVCCDVEAEYSRKGA